MWIPAKATVPPRTVAARAAGTSRCKDDGGVDLTWWHGHRLTRESHLEPPGEIATALPRVNHHHLRTFVLSDLSRDVCARAEPPDPQRPPGTEIGSPQRAVADDLSAHQGRGMHRVVGARYGMSEGCWHDRVLGVSAVGGPIGVLRAQVLATVAAPLAGTTGLAQPAGPHPIADAELGGRWRCHHIAHHLVAGNHSGPSGW